MKLPTLLLDLVKLALAASMLVIGASYVQAQPETPVKIEALRGGTPLNSDNPVTNYRQERDHPVGERDFVQQPPLIPHTTNGYQITKNYNKCMDCHAWQKTKESGATKVSVTHFRTRDGVEIDSVSPRRYFCTQCHVAQSDAKPLVGNSYTRARGLQ